VDNIELVKQVRNRSGASMSACKRVVEMAQGDVERALEMLQREGLIRAADRAGRITTKGRLHVYNHSDGQMMALVEVNSETDFAANTHEFREFCDAVAMQVVGMSPQYVKADDIPKDVYAHQQSIFAESSKTVGVSDEQLARIVAGKMRKWVTDSCLMEQTCAAQPEKTMEQLRVDLIGRCGENVTVRRFVRWEVGEGFAQTPSEAPSSHAAKGECSH
jgi:elongation factor Ts